jgi:arylamine N-acetyltransferase
MSLSPEQVGAYLDRIALPQEVRDSLREGGNGKGALKAVTTLQQYHMAAIPYETLDLHYSSHHSVPLDTETIYENVVTRKRGGSCLQVHQLFSNLLRSLGFQAYITAARVNAPATITADPTLNKSVVIYGPW